MSHTDHVRTEKGAEKLRRVALSHTWDSDKKEEELAAAGGGRGVGSIGGIASVEQYAFRQRRRWRALSPDAGTGRQASSRRAMIDTMLPGARRPRGDAPSVTHVQSRITVAGDLISARNRASQQWPFLRGGTQTTREKDDGGGG